MTHPAEKTPPHARPAMRYLTALLALIGCGDRDTPPASAGTGATVAAKFQYNDREKTDIGRYEVMPASEMVPMVLDRVRIVTLGKEPPETPASLPRAKVTAREIVVIDEAARMVRSYSRSGQQRFAIPIGTAAGSGLRSPVAITNIADTLRVLDLDPNRGIVAFDRLGQAIATTKLNLVSSTVDFVSTDSNYVVATIADDEEIAGGSGSVLWAVQRNGDVSPLGCTPDPLYRQSIGTTGLYKMFRFFGVSIVRNRVFCRQPVSPVVHILDGETGSIALLRRAPPFYQRGSDRPQTTNNVTVSRFRSTWTEHARFFARENGFISVYNSFDINVGRDTHMLFACDSTSGTPRCGVRESPGMPLDFLLPDTLVIAEPLRTSGDLQRIGFYRIRI